MKKDRIRFHRGDMSVGSMIVMIFSIIIVMILILSYASWHTQMSKNDEMYLIAGTYLRAMETTGYLNNEQKTQLTAELQNQGMKNISFEGTTLSETEYGEKISLHIAGTITMDVPSLTFTKDELSYGSTSTFQVNITRSGTSFH
jgi:hypothetical protein